MNNYTIPQTYSTIKLVEKINGEKKKLSASYKTRK